MFDFGRRLTSTQRVQPVSNGLAAFGHKWPRSCVKVRRRYQKDHNRSQMTLKHFRMAPRRNTSKLRVSDGKFSSVC
eukprot:6735419-Pyramimonas_sp.AAC.4